MKWTQRQGRAAAPASHHFGRQQLFILAIGRVGFEVAAEFRHPLVQLSKNNVGAVSPQDLRFRLLDAANFVPVAQHKLARLEGLFLGITPGNAAPFDGRMTDTVAETERLCLSREGVTILSPDCRDSLHLPIRLARASEGGLEPMLIRGHCHQHHVDILRPEWLLPVLRTALPDVAQLFRARGHPLTKLPRKTVKRLLRHAERFEPLMSQSNAHPRVSQRTVGIGGRSDNSRCPAY